MVKAVLMHMVQIVNTIINKHFPIDLGISAHTSVTDF